MRRLSLCVGAEVSACARPRWDLGAGFLEHEPRHNIHALELLEEQLAGVGDPAQKNRKKWSHVNVKEGGGWGVGRS